MILHDDCFNVLASMPDGSVDMILTDPPYGTTDLEWDTAPNLARMFAEFNRVAKPNGAIVVMAQQPFATDCIVANRERFRYELIWEKTKALGFLSANKKPLRAHENVLVFYKLLPTYNPQKTKVTNDRVGSFKIQKSKREYIQHYNQYKNSVYTHDGTRYPRSVVKFSNRIEATQHPTQKPLALFEYLIKTYTNEGETVLDCFAGSGTSAVAAINTGRGYIVIEKEEKYIDVIKSRVEAAKQTLFTQD
jgi:site-specific DNA-methyltransferase (adenine-specific)